MAPRTGFVLQPTYRVRGGVPVVRLFGRLDDGAAFLVEDDRFRPYFFVRERDAHRLRGEAGARVAPDPAATFAGEPVVRVTVGVPSDVPPLRERLRRSGAPCFEADVRFPYRYLMDRGVRAGVAIEGKGQEDDAGLLRFANPELAPATSRPALRVLSIDLETAPDASAIWSAALVGDGADEVHLVAPHPVAGATVHAGERALLETVAARVRLLDPDVLLGWNVVDFDLRVWDRRCRALGAAGDLGRLPGALRFQQDRNFARQSRADLVGRMVLDGIPLVRDAMRLDDYRLETAAQSILGRGKRIRKDVPDPGAEIARLYREDPEDLVAYNREDARLVREILEREGLLALCVERSLLSGMQLDRVGASVASFDLLYLPELRARGVVAPSVDREYTREGVHGGALLDPQPGLYRNVAVFDFRSLYPSLIRTFHLDPLAHARAGRDGVEAPNGARFAREGAILPGIVERFMQRRAEARRRGDRHADQAIKIMMNALFGVLGTPGCRFFDPAIANAITGFGQRVLGWTRDAFEAEGMRVLYGDTDSVFVQLEGERADPAVAESLRRRVEERVAERVRATHGVEPRLDLELQRVFDRFWLPRVRGGRSGSKKRYAGRVGERLVVVGLESVRRDWPRVARRLQQGMLERIFADAPAAPFVRDVVERVRAGSLDEELVYVKRLRKGELARYTAATPPHVQAARKAAGPVGPVVRYVITARGPEPVRPGEPVPPDVDRRHYVEKVLRPVAEAILAASDESFDAALGQPSQLSLL